MIALMTMTEWAQFVGILTAALVTVISTVAGAIVSIKTGKAMTRQDARLGVQDQKLDQIHVQTNNNLEVLREQNRRLETWNTELRTLNASLVATAREKERTETRKQKDKEKRESK